MDFYSGIWGIKYRESGDSLVVGHSLETATSLETLLL